jgi:hypothetical protein
MTNPVGTSTMQRLTNPSPAFSPTISPGLLSNEQRLGAFWNLATRRARPYTNADLPQLAAAGNEAVDAAMNWAGMTTPVVKGIRAFHGSPHSFDKFSLDKIGTGEGAQAYGHGLYFAGNENVARSYKSAGPYANKSLNEINARLSALAREIDKNSIGYNNFRDKALGAVQSAEYDALMAQRANLRTSPERLLDWDKPLSQQPATVREAMSNIPGVGKVRADSGDAAYASLQNILRLQGRGSAPEASAALRNAGLDGIQYLDAGSRAAGDGTRNYVMFDDSLIEILRRYGLMGLSTALGAAGSAALQYAPQGADQ